nr:immunoglobulin light chain junction region [Macaca mulatta]MOX84006.1 immunoglobulin light chain junction region [Macaca mulatta]
EYFCWLFYSGVWVF